MLRLAILTDIDRDNRAYYRAYYRLGIAPATVGGPDDAAKTLMIASRSKTGDIDVGGFRIAAVIASTLAPRPLLPWLMDPSDLASTDPAEDSMRQDMVRSARQAGWAELAQIMESFPPAVMEQEDVPVLLASAAGHMWGTPDCSPTAL